MTLNRYLPISEREGKTKHFRILTKYLYITEGPFCAYDPYVG